MLKLFKRHYFLEILLLKEAEEMAFCTETLKEVCEPVEDCHNRIYEYPDRFHF